MVVSVDVLPVWAILLRYIFDYLSNILNVRYGANFEIVLGFPDVVFV